MITTWRAIYDKDDPKDGVIVSQIKKDGSKTKYADLDRSRLKRFDLLHEDGKVAACVMLHEGQRLIYRRRGLIHIAQATGQEVNREVIYMLGYQFTHEGKNFVVINYIYEDGHVELDNSRNNLELYPIEQ